MRPRIHLTHVLSQSHDDMRVEPDVEYGRINTDILGRALPAPAADVRVIICGPPGFVTVGLEALRALGYTDEMLIVF